MKVVYTEVQELGIGDVIDAIAEHLRWTADTVDAELPLVTEADFDCAEEYTSAVRQLASDLEKIYARHERRVLRHLNGPCKAH